MKIAAILAVHNRCNETLCALKRLFSLEMPPGAILEVFLLDDSSSDGTPAAVREQFPRVNIITGDGTLYWNRGMARAFEGALKYDFDYYLWLNDDTRLWPQALCTLVRTAAQTGAGSIIVGSIRAPLLQAAPSRPPRASSTFHP